MAQMPYNLKKNRSTENVVEKFGISKNGYWVSSVENYALFRA